MSKIGSRYCSTVFGFNLARVVIVGIVFALCVYFWTERDFTALVICALLLLVLALFNIGGSVDDERVTISAFGIPVKRIGRSDVEEVKIAQSSSTLEKNTAGIHFLDGALSFHAGAANVVIVEAEGRPIRISVEDPAKFVEAWERH